MRKVFDSKNLLPFTNEMARQALRDAKRLKVGQTVVNNFGDCYFVLSFSTNEYGEKVYVFDNGIRWNVSTLAANLRLYAQRGGYKIL